MSTGNAALQQRAGAGMKLKASRTAGVGPGRAFVQFWGLLLDEP